MQGADTQRAPVAGPGPVAGMDQDLDWCSVM